MEIHAGIDIFCNDVKAICVENGVKKEYELNNFFKGEFDLEKTKIFFDNLKLKNNGELGCLCILNGVWSIERLKWHTAADWGFKKAEIISNEQQLIYYEAVTTYNLKKDHFVWIFPKLFIFPWYNIWQAGDEVFSSRYHDNENRKELEKMSVKYPPAIIYCYKDFSDKNFVKKMFPKVQFVEFNNKSYSKMALIYAQIMANEIVLSHEDSEGTASIPAKNDTNEESSKLTHFFNSTLSKLKKDFHSENASSHGLFQHFSLPKKIQTNNEKINAVGIDLGTSRCCAAVNRRNGIETVALDYKGERLLPSFIAFDEAHTKCGQIVVDRLRYYSKSTIFDSKRIIGREFCDIEIDEIWPFSVFLDDKNEVMLEVKTFDERNQISPESASASLLKYIKQKVAEFQAEKCDTAVITVPAAFTEAQKKSTLKAAKLAGWEKVELLPEPVAASFAYFINRPIPNNSKILLFDLGGGTLDVCIFKIQNNQIYVISNTGDSKLGGRDFERILMNYFLNILNTKFGISLADNKKYKLMHECQKIKENLSDSANSWLDVEEFDVSKEDELIYIDQEEFIKMTTSLMNRIQNTIYSALQTCGYKSNQIDKVLQVGGGSRMPMIKKLLRNIFPKAEHCCEENPDEVVAIGAAYYAYNILDKGV